MKGPQVRRVETKMDLLKNEINREPSPHPPYYVDPEIAILARMMRFARWDELKLQRINAILDDVN